MLSKQLNKTKANKDLGRSMEKVRVESQEDACRIEENEYWPWKWPVTRTKKFGGGIRGLLGGCCFISEKDSWIRFNY